MNQIVFFSDNKSLIKSWTTTLSAFYSVGSIDGINTPLTAEIVILDSKKIDSDEKIASVFANKKAQFLIFGSNWSQQNQINALMHGAAGYCDEQVSEKLLLQAVEQLLKGDVWIPRLLVPKVIGALVQIKASSNGKEPESSQLLNSLSQREREVVELIRAGDNNKTIASRLFISERTVKAHLTSIFKKLEVPNRLHLAIKINT